MLESWHDAESLQSFDKCDTEDTSDKVDWMGDEYLDSFFPDKVGWIGVEDPLGDLNDNDNFSSGSESKISNR